MYSVEYILGHVVDITDNMAITLAMDIGFKETPITDKCF
jgi:hypothetical protein